MKLDDIPQAERRQFVDGFVNQAQGELDQARQQLADAQRKLAEALVRHDVFKKAGLDATMTENAIKARQSAVDLLELDVKRLAEQLEAYQAYQVSS